jgi:hypothetical protein
MDAEGLAGADGFLRQLDHSQVIRPRGEVAGGKGCPPAANDFLAAV